MSDRTDPARPPPPGPDPSMEDAPPGPHPLDRPDERKEGGPDFGKAASQAEKHDRDAEDARQDAHPRIRREPGRAP